MNPHKRVPSYISIFIIITLLLGSVLVVRPVSAAGIVVNSIVDGFSSTDGLCSLREAIENANNGVQIYDGIGECAAGTAGADTITFAGDYTITVNSNLTITSDITITGNGALETIIQASACNPTIQICSTNHNIFVVEYGGNLTLDSVMVRHGKSDGGGGILNQGTLTVMDSTISANTAGLGGGIRNMGTLTVTSSTLSGNMANNGGGIANDQSLTVTDSTLSGNTAYHEGGGISNYGTLTVTSSTLSGNTADINGGGISNFIDNSLLTVTNSTLSGNTAAWSGGGINNMGEMMLTSSTLSGNIATSEVGGGIYNQNRMKYTNTIIADSDGGDCVNNHTILPDSTHNLVTDGSCGALLNADPMLGPLADNGGPTLTHALLPGSPAIDAGSGDHCPNTDQRGVVRPQDGDLNGVAVCDIGAFELLPDHILIYLPLIVR